MSYEFSGFISFYKTLEKVFWKARFPAFSCRKSKRLYSQFVHVFLHVLKEQFRLSYREVVEFAKSFRLERLFCIRRIPHFSTLQKFLQRIDKTLFERLVRACSRVLKLADLSVSVDSTGMALTNPSHYYQNRINAPRVKNFVKFSLVIDNKSKLILNVKTHSNNQHDNLDFKPLLSEITQKIRTVLADKAYDSEENLRFVLEDLKARVFIPVREHKQQRLGYGHKPLIHGKLRRRMFQNFDIDKYHQRSNVESTISSVKRLHGASVQARLPQNQEKNATIKALTYNIKKTQKLTKITIKIET